MRELRRRHLGEMKGEREGEGYIYWPFLSLNYAIEGRFILVNRKGKNIHSRLRFQTNTSGFTRNNSSHNDILFRFIIADFIYLLLIVGVFVEVMRTLLLM